METPQFNNYDSLRKAAIAVAFERTSDIFPYESEFRFTSISRNGIINNFFFSSERQAEWRLVEERLYIAADIIRIDIYLILEQIRLRKDHEVNKTEKYPPITDWTEWLPKDGKGWYDEITPPYYDTDVIITEITVRE